MFHFRRPLEKTPQVAPLPEQKFPEDQKSDPLHLYAAVSFDPPPQIRAAPGGQTVSASGVPQESQHAAHPFQYIWKASGWLAFGYYNLSLKSFCEKVWL
jgi:hypothetical protein